ncbi:MAG: hypothetical protein ACPG4Y_09450, partial [Chitinophagales bacterium]
SILQTIYIASTSYKNDAKELEKIKTFLAQNQFEKSKIEALNKQILSLKEKNKKEIISECFTTLQADSFSKVTIISSKSRL